jgi:hypothetical protein
MPANADSVVVELIAKNDQFDANVKSSSAIYQQSMGQIETAAGGAEKAHGRMTLAMNNNRIAMLEFQHIARGTTEQLAAGAPLTQALAQHLGMLGEAVGLAGGAFGSFGALLSGPWGLAVTAAVGALGILISKHKEETDTLDSAIKKRAKHREEAALNQQADEAWGHTIDGLIEKLTRLNELTAKKIELPNLVNQQSFTGAQALVNSLNNLIDKTEADPNSSPEQISKLYAALAAAVANLRQQTTVLGQQVGSVFSDLTKKADDWAQYQQNKIRFLTGSHPELLGQTGQIDAAFGRMKKAVDDAATANVPFDSFTKQVDALNQRLADSPAYVNTYISQLKALAKQLEAVAAAAKIDPVKQFENAVIGAEGTGPNKLGSSAAGFGQFMPGTWLEYFNRLFPDKAALDDASKLAFRNVKDVAMAVIDAATKDYVSFLQHAGQSISAANLYTVHLLGQRDAGKLLGADAGASTSDFLSAGVLRGNPFLRGTAGDARAAIASRIGDSSAAVSSAAITIQRTLDGAWDKFIEGGQRATEAEVKLDEIGKDQVNQAELYYQQHMSLKELIDSGILPSIKAWSREYDQLIDSQKELLWFGDQMIEDVLNPNNWKSWGSIGKTILHDLEAEMLTLAAINPLKNLLAGPNAQQLPTLGSIFSLFGGRGGGGGGGGLAGLGDFSNSFGAVAGVPHFAGGGTIGGFGGTDNNLLSINGVPRAMVSGDEQLSVIPSNARAASAFGGGGVRVVIGVQANDFFEGKVMSITGPAIAQSSAAAANGGAVISRRNLSREAQHRLE